METEKKTTKEMNALQHRLFNLIADKKFAGISQNKIAKEIGISSSQLTKYIDGDIEIGLNSLVKIADYFNCSLDYLIGRTKEKTTNEDIKTACKVTGLSESTIKDLKKINTTQVEALINALAKLERI